MCRLFNRKRRFRNTAQTKLADSAGYTGAAAGASVALSEDGTTAIVGAPEDMAIGSAVIYTRSGKQWTQQTKLIDPTAGGFYNFGYTVTLSNDGNTAIIGSPTKNTGGVTSAGSASLFTRSGSTWNFQHEFTSNAPLSNERFGASVAISDDKLRVAIGCAMGIQSFNLYIFFYNGSSWILEHKINTAGAGEDFGFSIAFNNAADTLLIGAPREDYGVGGAARDFGFAYVYTRSGTTWTRQQKLFPSIHAKDDYFGWSVALSEDGNMALIGMFGDDIGANTNQGSVVVFTRSGSTWTEQTVLTDSAGGSNHGFGYSLSLSGDGTTAIIGTRDPNNLLGTQEKVIVFNYNNGTWKQINALTDSDGVVGDYFGWSVALSKNNNIALIGARLDTVGGNTEQGSAIVFYRR